MTSRPSDSLPDLEFQQAIDAICDRFEQAWQAGGTPSLVDFWREASPECRPKLLTELAAIELEYGRDAWGQLIAPADLPMRHPDLAAELVNVLGQLLRMNTPARDRSNGCSRETTIATLRPDGSEGLHIRCPHCQVALELLADAPLDKINCHSCGSNFSLIGTDPEALVAAPRQVGRFELQERLGVGGFGSVWRAHDAALDRDVAVKIPRKGQLTSTEMELFFREARAAAQLRHPHIVPVHEVGRDGDTIFIVSDLILGESLANWLKEQAPSTREMTTLLAVVADALHYAHQQGVVHRDFKPSNVMIDQLGEPHLMDFGLAKREVGEVTMTIDGHIVGTPAYMSPEQATGGTHWVDRRTDVYSLGVVLFEVLTGELPFRGNAQMQIREKLTSDPPNPRQLNQKAPLDLATICVKCLEREPNRRYGTAAEVGDELRRYLRGEPILARPISQTGRLIRWGRRNPAPATAAALAAVLAVAGPLAALVINSQRYMIAGRLHEIELLVKENERKLDERDETISELTQERNELLGLTSDTRPADFEVVRSMIGDLLKSRRDALATLLAGDTVTSEVKARGHLAVAYLQAELNERAAARVEAKAAIGELKRLSLAEPDNLVWGVALGEAYRLLKQLDAPDQATTMTQRSEALKHTLELLSKANATKDHHQLSAIKSLTPNWPTDPDELYELACYLTQRPATLTESQQPATKAPSD